MSQLIRREKLFFFVKVDKDIIKLDEEGKKHCGKTSTSNDECEYSSALVRPPRHSQNVSFSQLITTPDSHYTNANIEIKLNLI